MARRKRSISRTIKSTKALVNVVNIDTKVVEERTYELPYALDDEKEILAEIEHNRWNVERLLNGDSAVPYDVRMELICGQLS